MVSALPGQQAWAQCSNWGPLHGINTGITAFIRPLVTMVMDFLRPFVTQTPHWHWFSANLDPESPAIVRSSALSKNHRDGWGGGGSENKLPKIPFCLEKSNISY
ncbi:hypothetical protein BaRGS_00023809 [Batillaria attramentaria]|uniref:Uncharacterized protein n=1 Tax=Batillaria attramentaria TaxID=370345 RepID=A0ABD0KDG6_9CAEN